MGNRLVGERALVTGASRGIGRAIAAAFAEEGASVVLTARSSERLERVASGLDAEILVAPGDVTDTESVNRVVERTVEAFDGLDVLVNNAGTVLREDLADTPDEDVARTIDVNLAGAMRVTRASLPALRRSEGAIVNVTSMAAERGIEGLSTYSATKGGLTSLTRQLAVAYAADGVRVNAVAPGTIETPLNEEARETDPGWVEERRAQVPLGRLGDPSDVADPVVFLASDAARYVTGHVLVVDGGVLASA